jgi:hypothetical protein
MVFALKLLNPISDAPLLELDAVVLLRAALPPQVLAFVSCVWVPVYVVVPCANDWHAQPPPTYNRITSVH